jgi:hypothetical protein
MSEPRDVGPLYGGDYQVSPGDRQLVITLLTAARADGRLSAADCGVRLSAAYAARTFDDLVPLTRDLMG